MRCWVVYFLKSTGQIYKKKKKQGLSATEDEASTEFWSGN